MKIISDGQTGADQGALDGGWAPRGFLTESGPALELAYYGLQEHASPLYPPRTPANVRDADATVWVGAADSPRLPVHRQGGEKTSRPTIVNPTADELREFCARLNVRTLNVSRTSRAPGIHRQTIDLLLTTFQSLK